MIKPQLAIKSIKNTVSKTEIYIACPSAIETGGIPTEYKITAKYSIDSKPSRSTRKQNHLKQRIYKNHS